MEREFFDVVIVGAGVAGVECARSLRSACPELRIVVLEAGQDIGGRVRSLHWKGSAIELGAGWIHGDDRANPLLALCANAGFAPKPIVQGNFWVDGTALTSGAPALQSWDTADEKWISTDAIQTAELMFEEAKTSIAEYARSHRDNPNETVFSAAMNYLRAKQVDQKGDNEGNAVKKMKAALLWQWMVWRLGCWYGLECDELSLKEWEEPGAYGDYPGAHCSLQPREDGPRISRRAPSFQQVVACMAEGLDVRLCHTVTRIETPSTSSSVVVKTERKEFAAKYCVVTIPLGALQKSHWLLFHPPLPDWKIGALEKGRVGGYKKVVFLYERCFWREFIKSAFVALIDTKSPTAVNELCPVLENYDVIKGTPALGVIIVGRAALKLTPEDDERLVDSISTTVRSLLSHCCSEVLEPSKVVVTDWERDPLFMGAYSTFDYRCEDPEEVIRGLGKSVGPVLFAGEACNLDFQGSLHGAVWSGRDAAQEIAQRLCKEAEVSARL